MSAPTFDVALDKAIEQAGRKAAERRHRLVTLDHLLLALTDNADACRLMSSCGIDTKELRDTLTSYVDGELQIEEGDNPKPSMGTQMALQRAVIFVMSSPRITRWVTGADALVAILSDQESHAAQLLFRRRMTRTAAMTYIAEPDPDELDDL
jgi:ATP-dependent Clp protease ATP-binding subunit ClpA